MRKSFVIITTTAIITLLFTQMAGTLVESIYILDLLNTALDEKVLGLLFFFTPVLLFLYPKKVPGWIVWVLFGLLFVARGLTPYLDTNGRMLASGVGTGTTLLLLPILITATPKGEPRSRSGIWASAGLALGVGLAGLLRTVNFTIDVSMTQAGSWTGWLLGLILGIILTQLDWEPDSQTQAKPKGVTSATFGIIMILTLVYFVFSAPGVLARWTEGNYVLIVSMVSLMASGWVAIILNKPTWLEHISPRINFAWNLLFTISLLGTILVQRVHFPMTPDSPPVVIGPPNLIQQIPLILTLVLFPVIFLDFAVFARTIRTAAPSPKKLVAGMLWGSLALMILIFTDIFTNVWGYVEPISPFFRNKYWLPFALIGGAVTLLGWMQTPKTPAAQDDVQKSIPFGWTVLLGSIFIVTLICALATDRVAPNPGDPNALVVMTYNIQQANDAFGEKSYERQLALIRQVSPDIVALQESDSTRISLNNNDYVRYFASKLGYYSYYGPTTVSGTYGTAILSKFPLQNTRTVFSYSDQDEIGTTEAEILVNGRRFTIYNVHPDGSEPAMLTFAQTVLARTKGKDNVIVLGDFNLREDEAAYQLIDAVLTNAWISVFPTGVSDTGLDMSGEKRIDHIFFSPDLNARNPIYILAPESATDHPVHWAEITW